MQFTAHMTTMARTIFWTAALLLFYVYAGYPLLLSFIALFRRRKKLEPGYCPRISVLIAAYNEEAAIERKIRQTLALEYPVDKIEVLVLSDCSTDRTDEIVSGFGDPRVRLVRMTERRGKTHAQNQGIKHATGEVIIFSDATAIYHSQALMYLACNYQDASVGAVSGRYQYFDPGGQSPTGLGSIAFWNYENFIKKMKVTFLLGRRVNQAWVRGRIPGLEFLDRLEIACVRHHDGEFLELLELTESCPSFLFGGGSGHKNRSFRLGRNQSGFGLPVG